MQRTKLSFFHIKIPLRGFFFKQIFRRRIQKLLWLRFIYLKIDGCQQNKPLFFGLSRISCIDHKKNFVETLGPPQPEILDHDLGRRNLFVSFWD